MHCVAACPRWLRPARFASAFGLECKRCVQRVIIIVLHFVSTSKLRKPASPVTACATYIIACQPPRRITIAWVQNRWLMGCRLSTAGTAYLGAPCSGGTTRARPPADIPVLPLQKRAARSQRKPLRTRLHGCKPHHHRLVVTSTGCQSTAEIQLQRRSTSCNITCTPGNRRLSTPIPGSPRHCR